MGAGPMPGLRPWKLHLRPLDPSLCSRGSRLIWWALGRRGPQELKEVGERPPESKQRGKGLVAALTLTPNSVRSGSREAMSLNLLQGLQSTQKEPRLSVLTMWVTGYLGSW